MSLLPLIYHENPYITENTFLLGRRGSLQNVRHLLGTQPFLEASNLPLVNHEREVVTLDAPFSYEKKKLHKKQPGLVHFYSSRRRNFTRQQNRPEEEIEKTRIIRIRVPRNQKARLIEENSGEEDEAGRPGNGVDAELAQGLRRHQGHHHR